MSEQDDFLSWVVSRLKGAEVALHNGDAGPRFAIWSAESRSRCSARGCRAAGTRR
jgi:hypothetical protein